MAVIRTGVKATQEELAALKAAAARGWRPGEPVIAFSVAQGIERDEATLDAQRLCHRYALKHGLPDIAGYYGIRKDGEFVRVE